jgi:hypothetical protein
MSRLDILGEALGLDIVGVSNHEIARSGAHQEELDTCGGGDGLQCAHQTGERQQIKLVR